MSFIIALVLAAASQYTYKHIEAPVEVTGAQAATAADWFISRGAWTGNRAAITWCAVYRDGDAFKASCHGSKTVNADMLPAGAQVLSVIN